MNTENEDKPTMYIVAGPNGAGKSTIYNKIIKNITPAPFINADLIQKNELRNDALEAAYDAAKIAEKRRQNMIAERKDFVFESTFSHPSKIDLIDEAKKVGFKIITFHVNVKDASLSVLRVAERVKEGGHNVPEDKIIKRFHRNQYYIKQAVLKSDKAYIYDNSQINKAPTLLLILELGKLIKITDKKLPAWADELYDVKQQKITPLLIAKKRRTLKRNGGKNSMER